MSTILSIAVIPVKNYQEARQQLAAISNADAIELRLDYDEQLNIHEIALLKQACPLPVIFTLRKSSQGGSYSGTEASRLTTIMALCELAPHYFDIEYDVDPTFITELHQYYPNIKLICSYHNFIETPQNLTELLGSLQQPYFDSYKIATTAVSTLDALRMLLFIKQNAHIQLTGLCMGELGQATRILGPVVGSFMCYTSINEAAATAPGQLTLTALNNVYHFHTLNNDTKIYALLGDPVTHSVGHILHNKAFRLLQYNAVYIKLKLTADELAAGIALCHQIGFAGFSVTMPLKQAILPLLNSVDAETQAMSACNSVMLIDDQYHGFNTDGVGAITALTAKTTLRGKTVVILGAGGAARSIAYATIKQHARVIIVNRTLAHAQELANIVGCAYADWNKLAELVYDVLINTLPVHRIERILPQTVAMDIVYQPMLTPFLALAQQNDCICVYGYEMFVQQALLQLVRWLQLNAIQVLLVEEMMRKYFAARRLGFAYAQPNLRLN